MAEEQTESRTETIAWAGTKEAATKAILDAMPKDVIVRGEDDGVGRFAGERILVLVGPERLHLFEGSWSALKTRLDDPQLEVTLEGDDGDVSVKLHKEKLEAKGPSSIVLDFVWNAATVAAVVVAYHFVRKIPVDVTLTAIIGAAGGVIWTLIARRMASETTAGLDTRVREALADPADAS